MATLSPKLEERRRQRESRSRPWLETGSSSSLPTRELARLSLGSSTSTPSKNLPKAQHGRKSYLGSPVTGNQSRFKPRRTGPFPFQRLPYEIQILVGQFVVQQYRQPMKCADFISQTIRKHGEHKKRDPPLYPLSRIGRPIWIPLLKVCPWLSKDLTRIWYKYTTFFARTVEEWRIFAKLVTPENLHRIRKLHLDNELIYGTGREVGESEDWRSHTLLSPMKSLEVLTLYRDDGGPGTYTHSGSDDFNSVEWFVDFAKNCKSVQHIRFALYPWSGFDKYKLEDSNMVVWVEDWEHKWEPILQKRRKAGDKPVRSWYLTYTPRVSRLLANGTAR